MVSTDCIPEDALLIAFGTNLPSQYNNSIDLVDATVSQLKSAGLMEITSSRPFRTPSFPKGSGPDYTNAVFRARAPSGMQAEDLLQILHDIEEKFGRTRSQRWASRTLDLDLLAFGTRIAPDLETHRFWRELPLEIQQKKAPERLILPHPRLQDRAFVLVPLHDVAAQWRHPILGLTTAEMLARLPAEDLAQVVAIAEFGEGLVKPDLSA